MTDRTFEEKTADQLKEDTKVSAALDLARKCRSDLNQAEIQELAEEFGRKIGIDIKKEKKRVEDEQ